jgi:hypothetical protein
MAMNGTHQPEAAWRRPSCCAGGECAEIAKIAGTLRSSTDPSRVTRYTTDEWRALVQAIKAEFADLD